jgi:hypothetical protein
VVTFGNLIWRITLMNTIPLFEGELVRARTQRLIRRTADLFRVQAEGAVTAALARS